MFWETRQNKERRERAVNSLIESPSTYECGTCHAGVDLLICSDCAALCTTFLLGKIGSPKPDFHLDQPLPNPTEIKTILDRYVIA